MATSISASGLFTGTGVVLAGGGGTAAGLATITGSTMAALTLPSSSSGPPSAMLEHLWQLVLHDRAKEAAELRRKLESQLAALQVAQRKYFRADLARLPRL